MAGKPKNRLELRRQYDAAEPPDPMEADDSEEAVEEGTEAEETERRPKKRAKAPAKPKAKSTKAPKPAARVRIVWTVFNDAFKPIATFEYAQRKAADTKAAEMTAKGKGTHFVAKVKEAMPEDAPGLGAAIPRAEPVAVTPKRAKPAARPVADEELEDDEETEAEAEEEEDED